MPASRPSNKGRLLNVILILLILAAALAAKPAKILYHDSAMRSAWIESVQGNSTNIASVAKFQHHCEALVSLGYLAKREFHLASIKSRSKEHEALFQALNGRASKGTGYFLIQGFEEKTDPMVTVYAPPGEMAGWESVITAHDRAK